MKFSQLKQDILAYVNKDHHRSAWDPNKFHFGVKTMSNGNKHYYITYVEAGKHFRISICNNNIKFNKVQNIPGAVSSLHGRILGPCIKFARHHGKWNGMTKKRYDQLNKANKWEKYDCDMFDKNTGIKPKKSAKQTINGSVEPAKSSLDRVLNNMSKKDAVKLQILIEQAGQLMLENGMTVNEMRKMRGLNSLHALNNLFSKIPGTPNQVTQMYQAASQNVNGFPFLDLTPSEWRDLQRKFNERH